MNKKKANYYEIFFLTFMLGIAGMILYGPELKFIIEFLPQIMILFLLMGLLFLIANEEKMMMTSLAFCGLVCVLLKNESNPDLITPDITTSPKVNISTYNLANIASPDELRVSIQESQPDILLFQEFTPDWSLMLHELIGDDYIYETTLLRSDIFGKAIYSKLPINNVDTISDGLHLDLGVTISTKGVDYKIYSSYISPSLDQNSRKSANTQLNLLAVEINKQSVPTLSAGEFNHVYWSEQISSFREKAHLKNSRKNISPANFKSAYDHIFYSDDLECVFQSNLVNELGSKIGYHGQYQLKSQSFSKLTRTSIN